MSKQSTLRRVASPESNYLGSNYRYAISKINLETKTVVRLDLSPLEELSVSPGQSFDTANQRFSGELVAAPNFLLAIQISGNK